MNLLSYSLQTGAGLCLMYAFYRVFLVRLTFYKPNRFYLVGYSLFCLFVPLLNTNGLWPRAVDRYTVYVPNGPGALPNVVATPGMSAAIARPIVSMDWPHALQYLLLAGMAVMLLRILVQVFSLLRLRRKATLLSEDNGIRLCLLPYPLAPFSFGHSIFIPASAQTSGDLARIVQHETAHIRQRHTLDIMLSQAFLVLQWWNPIAWLLARSIRQNLEFLADQAVLDQGADPKQYQYLLLRVSGVNVPALSNPFNFSPLKKRIAMMNKQRSGRRQVSRFLFALPLLLVLLAAASRHRAGGVVSPYPLHIYGFVVNGASLQPLADADVTDHVSGVKTTTDATGFFILDIPAPPEGTDTLKVRVLFSKEGYDTTRYFLTTSLSKLGPQRRINDQLDLVGLAGNEKNRRSFCTSDVLFPPEDEGLRKEGSPTREESFKRLITEATSGPEALPTAQPGY